MHMEWKSGAINTQCFHTDYGAGRALLDSFEV
jgi:hypothetical protein